MLHSRFRCWKKVDSRLLVVGSQTASLTPSPSFAHNLGYGCPNDQCEAIFDIYTSRPFQGHQEHPKARCFSPFCRTLKFQESRRTPSPQLWECEFHPHTWPKWGCDNWPNLKDDAKEYVKTCLTCRQNQTLNKKQAGLLQPLPIPEGL